MSKIEIPRKLLKPIEVFLQERRKQLLKKKKQLELEDPFANPERTKDTASIDGPAQDRFEHERVRAMRLQVDKMLVRIRKALTMIKLGSYGNCETCQKMIDTDRLALDPTTTKCVDCAAKE